MRVRWREDVVQKTHDVGGSQLHRRLPYTRPKWGGIERVGMEMIYKLSGERKYLPRTDDAQFDELQEPRVV